MEQQEQENQRFVILLPVHPGLLPLTERQLAERRREQNRQLHHLFVTTANELIQLLDREPNFNVKLDFKKCNPDSNDDDGGCPPAA